MTRDAKSIRVRCGSWDQVEAFYNEKVLASRGNILVVKMPFRPGIGEAMTVALTLPDGLVFAIDGTVVKIGADDGGRVPVAVRLHGLGTEVRAQLKRLVAQGRGQASGPTTPVGGTRAVGTRPPAPPPPVRALIETVPPPSDPNLRDVAPDERDAFDALAATRERVSALPAHEVLGVASDTTGETLKSAYLAAAHEVHPDRYRRFRSPALRVLAADVFVMVRRAYERMAQLAGPARQEGWLLAMPDGSEPAQPGTAADSSGVPVEALQASGSAPYSEISITAPPTSSPPASYEEDVSFTTSVRMRALTAEELFDDEPTLAPPPPAASTPAPPAAAHPVVAPRSDAEEIEAAARAALAEGRYREACEGFAAYLRIDPRNRIVRALYHVASGLDMRAKGEGVKARLQFETALAHNPDCDEARRALGHEQPERERKTGIFKRLFDK